MLLGSGAHRRSATPSHGSFISSPGFKALSDPSSRAQQFSTGLVQVSDSPLGRKGTLLEGTGSPGTGTGGGLVTVPQVVPGVVQKLFQPLTFEAAAHRSTGHAPTPSDTSWKEQPRAAPRALLKAAPSRNRALGLSTLDEPIKKIATSSSLSDEMLEDVPAIQAFINGRLSLFVNIETERQLLRGTAGGAEVQGLLTSRGVPVYAGGTAAGDKAAQLFKAMNGMPRLIVRRTRVDRDAPNRLAGNATPDRHRRTSISVAARSWGSMAAASKSVLSGQLTGAADTIWGKPVYVTTAIGGAGTALIGSSAAACVWSRGGLSVEATNCALRRYL